MNDASWRFLADESCDFGIVKALRAEGYEVLALTEITTRSVDSEVMGNELRNAFVVMQPGHIRMSRNK